MSVRVTNLLAPLLIEVALLLLHNVLRPLPLQRRDHLVRVRARARVGGWGWGWARVRSQFTRGASAGGAPAVAPGEVCRAPSCTLACRLRKLVRSAAGHGGSGAPGPPPTTSCRRLPEEASSTLSAACSKGDNQVTWVAVRR